MSVKDDIKKVERKLYRLVFGKHVGVDEEGNSKLYKEGDKVPLTKDQADAFGDKFEAVDKKADKDADPNPHVTPTQPQQDAKNPAQTDKAPNAPETKPGDGATGAGSAANSTNAASATK